VSTAKGRPCLCEARERRWRLFSTFPKYALGFLTSCNHKALLSFCHFGQLHSLSLEIHTVSEADMGHEPKLFNKPNVPKTSDHTKHQNLQKIVTTRANIEKSWAQWR